MRSPFIYSEDTPTVKPPVVKSESYLPGPQKRGTAGTLKVVGNGQRDRGHPPPGASGRPSLQLTTRQGKMRSAARRRFRKARRRRQCQRPLEADRTDALLNNARSSSVRLESKRYDAKQYRQFIRSSHIIPGPQLRGTGGTLSALRKSHRDRGHPPPNPAVIMMRKVLNRHINAPAASRMMLVGE